MKTPSLSFLICGLLALGPVFSFAQEVEGADPVTSLSLERRVGQLFMIGFQQKGLDQNLKKIIRQTKPGGFILFRRNLPAANKIPAFSQDLAKFAREHSGFPPFLAVDQEGGLVTRIPFFPSLPSAHAIGLGRNEALAREFGEESGRLLRWAGFNMNLAPVLDLSNPLKMSFLGSRSFGDDPEMTARLGVAYAEGLLHAGILPTGKHFPGLGGLVADLHKTTVTRDSTPDAFRSTDLRPFMDFSRLGPNSALMISQMSYPFLDPSGRPASFSSKILKDLLRRDVGFRGLIITDDLQMKGSTLVHTPEEASLESLKAGADVIMITWSFQQQQKALERVMQAVRSGEWPESELNDRVRRILSVKRSLIDGASPLPMKIGHGPDGTPGSRRLEQLDLKLLDNKIRRSGLKARTPAQQTHGAVCAVASDKHFLDSFRQGRPEKTKVIHLQKKTSARSITKTLEQNCSWVIFAVSGAQTSRLLELLPLPIREKTYAVNLSVPAVLSSSLKLAGRLEIGHPHLHAGYRVAQLFVQK